MTDQTALPPLLAAARALELDRDAASSGETDDYRRGMTRAVQLLRILNEEEPAGPAPAADRAGELRGIANYLQRRGADLNDGGLTAAADLLRRPAGEPRLVNPPGVEVLGVVVGPDGEHRYVSTYCVHGDCTACRRDCKTCHAVCLHGCHEASGEAGP